MELKISLNSMLHIPRGGVSYIERSAAYEKKQKGHPI